MKKAIYKVGLLCLITIMLGGCGKSDLLDPKKPVTLTLWHTYVEQMMTGMEELVAEFNSTVGAQKGIAVITTSVANAPVLNEKLIMAANGDPGAPKLPDMAVVYPNVAVELVGKGLLMDFSSQFSAEELSRYVPAFLEEGKLGGETLYILPIAKSTEVLYVNTTIFDRFAKENNVTLRELATVEGILRAAEKYYTWTDGKTPDIPGDGKAFFYPEALFNFAMIGFEQLGDDFVAEQALNVSSPTFQRIWDAYYPYAVKGSVAVFGDYGNYLAMTGDIVCNIGTSAGVTYYPQSVTYPDNTKEDARFAILPYPVFEGGKKVALQRGGGMCVFASDSRKEYAAGVFLKWLTAPEQNLQFTSNTGYMPVTEAAFDNFMAQKNENIKNENIIKLFEAVVAMQKEYTFTVPPVFSGFEELQKRYKENLLKTVEGAQREYLGLLEEQAPDAAYGAVSQGAMQRFITGY